MKQLTPQILALYLGCEVKCSDGYKRKLVGINQVSDSHRQGETRIQVRMDSKSAVLWFDLPEIEPILSRLSSITEEQRLEVFKCQFGDDAYDAIKYGFTIGLKSINPESFLYLLSIGVDLFYLIDSGLAIEKVSTSTQPT